MTKLHGMACAVLAVALSSVTLSCNAAQEVPSATAGQNRSADEAAIRAQIGANEAAGNKRDFEGVAATYALDGDLMRLAGPRVIGRAAIGQLIKEALATTPATSQNTFTIESIRFVAPDVAVVETTLHFSEGPLRAERGTLVMVRQDGTWPIAAARVLPAQLP
jgi:uncharacterized protein (TIGR02246 family)